MKKIYVLALASLIGTGAFATGTKKVRTNDKKASVSASKNIGGGVNSPNQIVGTLVCNTPYVAGTTMDLTFDLQLTNTDAEYGDQVDIIFPAGFTINSTSTDPLGVDDGDPASDGPEAFVGIVGQTITWGNNDNNYGGIVPVGAGGSDTYTAVINVTIDAGVTGLQTATFNVSGDGYGAAPADLVGGTCSMVSASSADAAIVGLTFPTPDCDLTAAEVLSVFIKNTGGTDISNFNVSYDVNGTMVTEVYTGTITAGNTAQHVFAATADLSTPGIVYTIIGSVALTGDVNAANDADTGYTAIILPTTDTLLNTFSAMDGSDLLGWSQQGANPLAWYYSGTENTGDGGASWAWNNGAAIATADEWLFTPCIELTEWNNYTFSFFVNTFVNAAASFDVNFEVFVADNQSPTANMMSIGTGTLVDNATFTQFTYPFASPRTGVNVMAIHFTTAAGIPWFRTDDYALTMDRATVGMAKKNTVATSVYPNPSNGVVNVKTAANSSVVVTNVLGTVVYNGTVNAGTTGVNLSNLANGVYTVKVNNGSTVTVENVVINK